MILKFTYTKLITLSTLNGDKTFYPSIVLNDDMTKYIYNCDYTLYPDIYIDSDVIWNLLYNGTEVQRKLGYNLYKNTLK